MYSMPYMIKKIYRSSSFAELLALEQYFNLTCQYSDKGPVHQCTSYPNLPNMNGIRPRFSSGSALSHFPWLELKFSCNNLVANRIRLCVTHNGSMR